MRMRLFIAAATLLTLGVFGVSAASAGGPTRCVGAEGPVTIKGGVIAGPGCNLSETTVEGNVTVEPNGSLTTNEGSTTVITGNVQSSKATEISLRAKGSIGGNVQIQGTTGGSNLHNGTVKGNVQIQNSLAFVNVALETVGGNVQLQNNTGADGAVGCVAASGPGCAFVGVERSTVGGNVLVGSNSLTATEANEVFVERNSVAHGNVQIQNNSAAGGSAFNGMLAIENQVGTNLEVHNNTAQGGPNNVVEVSDNTVTNNLACMNDKPPASGRGNTANKKTGECAGL
jgi:hypothetical protein